MSAFALKILSWAIESAFWLMCFGLGLCTISFIWDMVKWMRKQP